MQLFGLTHETTPAQTIWHIKPSEMKNLPEGMGKFSFLIHPASRINNYIRRPVFYSLTIPLCGNPLFHSSTFPILT